MINNRTLHMVRGMTLVEMLVVIGLFTILSLFIFGAAQNFYKTHGYSLAQAEEIDHARRGVTKLARDLREMTYSENGIFPIAEMGEHSIGFYSDIDKDDNVEYIEYELVDTVLYKRVYNPTGFPPSYDLSAADSSEIISEYVQNNVNSTSTFFYYDTNNNNLGHSSNLTGVRYIRAQIIVNIDPIRSPGEFMLRTSIAPRNLKDNL